MLHWQEITQELDSYAIRQKRGPSNLLTEQFRGAPFREQRRDWTPTALLVRLQEQVYRRGLESVSLPKRVRTPIW